ncbi:Leucine-rich repeat-containing protein 40 [Rhizoclosmatium sp. JEL0117]|nr:Leucine-rich repeat-containing protein 40 [Rhizoclosmatium sp. JEL0117]
MLQNRRGNPTTSSFQRPTNTAAATASQSVLKLVAQARSTGRLNLSNQSLTAVPDVLFTRADVRGADVSLDQGGGNWWEETDLTKLVIADNEIESIDERVAELGALTMIDAHNNKISTLPDLSALGNLTVLHLASNSLVSLPDSIWLLNLAELNISHNRITFLHIPPTSPAALSLAILDASNNQLSNLPLTSAPRLTKLMLKSNMLSGPLPLPPQGTTRPAFPLLNNLDLSHNRLTTLTTLPYHTPNLIILTASQNQLEAVFTLTSPVVLPGLLQLDLRINRLTTLECPVTARNLKELLLQTNKLVLLSGALYLSAVGSLETLDVRENSLDALPKEIVDMGELKRLFVEGNLIRNPRHAVIEKGTAAMVQWMKERVVV